MMTKEEADRIVRQDTEQAKRQRSQKPRLSNEVTAFNMAVAPDHSWIHVNLETMPGISGFAMSRSLAKSLAIQILEKFKEKP